jgi:predicted methyltransferase
MADNKTKRLLDYNGLFLELQQAIVEEYKIEQRLLQEEERVETADEGKEFAKLRRMVKKEKDVKKVIRDILVLQEATTHAVAYLLSKNNERLIALFSEKLEQS